MVATGVNVIDPTGNLPFLETNPTEATVTLVANGRKRSRATSTRLRLHPDAEKRQ